MEITSFQVTRRGMGSTTGCQWANDETTHLRNIETVRKRSIRLLQPSYLRVPATHVFCWVEVRLKGHYEAV